MKIQSPHPADTLAVFAITLLLGLALAGIVVSFLVSR
jgi:hypothetical protein